MNGASRTTRTIRIIAATGLLLLLAIPAVAAYEGEVAQTVTVTPPAGGIQCGVNTPVSATLLDGTGQPVGEAPVTWTFTQVVSSQDAIVEPNTTSDAQGVATTDVWLACVNGERRIEARSGDAVGGAVLGVTGVGAGTPTEMPSGLPNTSTATLGPSSTGAGNLLAVVVIGLIVGAALSARRVARR